MTENNNNNALIYWLGGGFLVVLVLVALSVWTPDTGPETIAPAAGDYIADTNTQRGMTADDMNNSGALGGSTSTVPNSGPNTGIINNTPADTTNDTTNRQYE